MSTIRQTEQCKPYFITLKILTVPCLFILKSILIIRKSIHIHAVNRNIHNHNTRSRNDLHVIKYSTNLGQKNSDYLNKILYNHLSKTIKDIKEYSKFKDKLTQFLIKKAYYSIQDFISEKTTDN